MPKPILAASNQLIQLEAGYWVRADADQRVYIDYTDGDSNENAVRDVILKAKDRSVDSYEFDCDWPDWALEYHLTSKRANIYRGLDFAGVERVLEVGCGCGAISRFLGEQGCLLDSIEGSPRRAEIARLRTSELDNVQIICSNYHQLDLPAATYDRVVFTGVLEYSGAYAADGMTPEQQVVDTLKSALAALKPDGSILIAIENRTGIKYVNGASEDHLVVPHIGLLGYPESKTSANTRGIRTWSKREWRELLALAGVAGHEFAYPFPDYKVPQVVLSDSFLSAVSCPEEVLGGVESGDYGVPWLSPVSEPVFWKAAAATGSIGEFSNSFLIVANKSVPAASRINFDFVRFASVRRKLEYRQTVKKLSGEADVLRIAALDEGLDAEPKQAKQAAEFLIHREFKHEPYAQGRVLSQYWADMLAVYPSYDELAAYLQEYYAWLQTQFEAADEPLSLVDALPQNIIMGDDGWVLIDQEWQANGALSAQQVFFRALLNFCFSYRHVLSGLAFYNAEVPIISIRDMLRWGFEVVGCPVDERQLAAFLDWEGQFQRQVVRAAFRQDLHGAIDEAIYQGRINNQQKGQSKAVELEVYWSQVDGVWHGDHSCLTQYAPGEPIAARIKLPAMLASHRYVRIDPVGDDVQAVNVRLAFKRLALFAVDAAGKAVEIYTTSSLSALPEWLRSEGVQFESDDVMLITSRDSQLIFDLQGLDFTAGVDHVLEHALDHVLMEIDLLPMPVSGSLAESRWLEADQMLAGQVASRQNELNVQQKQLDMLNRQHEAAELALATIEEKIKVASQSLLGRLKRRLFGV